MLGAMPDQTSRERAAQQVDDLVALLSTAPQDGVVPELVDLGGHLARAIRAFHMEAIRFRAFTMGRLIRQHAADLPPDVETRMEQVRAALEEAGFQTKSVST
jgi:hypothetical protein